MSNNQNLKKYNWKTFQIDRNMIKWIDIERNYVSFKIENISFSVNKKYILENMNQYFVKVSIAEEFKYGAFNLSTKNAFEIEGSQLFDLLKNFEKNNDKK